MLLEFGKSNLVQKALSQPQRVQQVVQKVFSDGIASTINSVRFKLDSPYPLGYCNAGVVVDRAEDISEFKVGDRVVSNGHHAEFVCVPKNLCASTPDSVSDEQACFAVVGATGLQSIRLLAPTFGERIGLIGLGLVGLLTGQLLRSAGCQVLGFEFNRHRLQLAERFGIKTLDLNGAQDPVSRAFDFSQGVGLDGIIIAASATSNDPIKNAATMCRQRGRIVLVGVCGLELDRDLFYKKELNFQVSCSYGPGRYDPHYEEEGRDYPIGYVRWTAQRNFQAVLEAMAERKLDVAPLITDRIPQQQASLAYDRLSQADSVGIILQYPVDVKVVRRVENSEAASTVATRPEGKSTVRVGMIGAGSFSRSTLLPILRQSAVELRGVASQNGLGAAHVAHKFGFQYSASDVEEILRDKDTDVVFIATPHNTHAPFVVKALASGKHVFVEKPLCISEEQLKEVEEAYHELAKPRGLQLMIGLNRRFSPFTQKLRSLMAGLPGPLSMVYTVNAGFLPAGHWTKNPDIGGGRIIGEGCHFIDLLSFLARSPVEAVQASVAGADDEVTMVLRMRNGSVGTVHYLASGHRSYPKETLQVFAQGSVLVLENFRRLRGYGVRGFGRMSLWRQDKGHRQEIESFLRSIKEGGAAPIPFESIANVTRASFAAVRAARTGSLETCL